MNLESCGRRGVAQATQAASSTTVDGTLRTEKVLERLTILREKSGK